jgi:hypothetical protein
MNPEQITTAARPRKPWLAALFSLVVASLGQMFSVVIAVAAPWFAGPNPATRQSTGGPLGVVHLDIRQFIQVFLSYSAPTLDKLQNITVDRPPAAPS